jgi:hypothetical protein
MSAATIATVASSGMSSGWRSAGAAVRLSIAVFPEAWRERYADEVADTLDDVARASGRSRPPLGDLLSLFVRGLALRARGSVAFWLIAAGVVVQLLLLSQYGLAVDRSWTSIAARSATGLLLGLPVVAGAAAWTSGRRAALRLPTGARLRGALRDAAAVAAVALAGWLAVAVGVLLATGLPAAPSFDAGFLLGPAAMIVGAIAVGTAIGSIGRDRVLRGILVVAAGMAVYGWLQSNWWQGADLGWRRITGFDLLDSSATLGAAADQRSVLLVAVGAVVLVGLAALVVAIPGAALRAPAVTVLAVLSILALSLSSPMLLPFVGSSPHTYDSDASRTSAELDCRGTAPAICLWPEQQALDGDRIRALLTAAHADAAALGVPVADRITMSSQSVAGADQISTRTDATSQRILETYAAQLVYTHPCAALPVTLRDNPPDGAVFGLTILMGGDPAAVPVTPRPGIEMSKPIQYLDRAAARDYLGVHDRADAAARVHDWFACGA